MRAEALPDIPTFAEFVPGYEASTWYGVGAPNFPRLAFRTCEGRPGRSLLERRPRVDDGGVVRGSWRTLVRDWNLSQNRLKRMTRQASWTKPRKLWAWYSQRMRIRRCH